MGKINFILQAKVKLHELTNICLHAWDAYGGTKKRRGAKKAPRAPGRFLVILINSSILPRRFLVTLKSAGTIGQPGQRLFVKLHRRIWLQFWIFILYGIEIIWSNRKENQ